MINGKHIFKIFLRVYYYTSIHGLFHFVNFFTKKKKKTEGKNSHFISKLSIIPECVADFSRISSETWIFRPDPEISALVIHEPTLLPLPLLSCSCVSRKKRRKEKRKGKEIEKRRRKIALHATFWQIYITYLWKIHVSRANLRRKFYFILFTSFLFILNWKIERNSRRNNYRIKEKIFLENKIIQPT